MRLTQFGNVELPYHNADDDFRIPFASGLIDVDDGAVDLFSGDEVRVRSRQITRSFDVVAYGGLTLSDRADLLLSEFAKGVRLLRAVRRDGQQIQTFARVADVRHSFGVGQGGYMPMQVTFLMPYPFWLASADEPIYFDDGYYLDAGWNFDSGNVETLIVNGLTEGLTIDNDGGVRVPRGHLQLTVDSGSVENLKVENQTNGHWFQYVGTLVAADVLTINLLAASVRLNGTPAYADLAVGNEQGRLMLLETGSNSIVVTATAISGSSTLKWQWSRHYLI